MVSKEIKTRAFDLLMDKRSEGDHGFTKGGLLAWKRQRGLYQKFFRAILTDATTEVAAQAGRFARNSTCPQQRSAQLGRSNERGTKGGANWVSESRYLTREWSW